MVDVQAGDLLDGRTSRLAPPNAKAALSLLRRGRRWARRSRGGTRAACFFPPVCTIMIVSVRPPAA